MSKIIFTRITNLKSAKEIWEYLKAEYQGSERTKGMQVLNLGREFEMQNMKDNETIKGYADRLLSIANKVRLLGRDFSDERIVQKILVTIPEKYESKISALEESKDLSTITLGELINALQAQEQRRTMRQDEVEVQGMYRMKAQNPRSGKKQQGENFPSCPHCKKTNHPQTRCFWRPDIKCRKCGNMGHVERVCNSEPEEAKVTMEEQEDDELLLVTTCFAASNISSNSWLIDSGCTNHMTNDKKLFKELDKSIVSKVKIGNGDFIPVKGKGTVVIESLSGLKYISDVLYVPDIDQNLLSVAQLVEKGFKIIFEDNMCVIKDAKDRDMFKVKMKAKCFALNLAANDLPLLSMEADDSTTKASTLKHVSGSNSDVGSDDIAKPEIHVMVSDNDHKHYHHDEELKHKIIKQVEYYFSDENLPTDEYLLSFVKKNKEGFVPISIIASFRRMKNLTQDYSFIVAALKESSLLVVSDDGRNVKRLNALYFNEIRDHKLYAVLVENMPQDCSKENCMKIFHEVRNIKRITIHDSSSTAD